MFAIESVLQLINSGVGVFCYGENNKIRWNIFIACGAVLWLLYPLSLMSLYFLFGIKLIESFEDSVIQVSKLNKQLFYSSIASPQGVCFRFDEKISS